MEALKFLYFILLVLAVKCNLKEVDPICDIENCTECIQKNVCKDCTFFFKPNEPGSQCEKDLVKIILLTAVCVVSALVVIALIFQVVKVQAKTNKKQSKIFLYRIVKEAFEIRKKD